MRATASEHRPAVVSARRKALQEPRFWSIAGPFAMVLAAQVGVILYQVSYPLPLLGTDGTSVALVSTSISAILGRLALGVVVDRIPHRGTSAAVFSTQAASLGLMLAFPSHPISFYLASTLFGLCIGNVLTFASLILQREFSPSSFGSVLGLSTAIGQVAYAMIPIVLGAIRDLAGGCRALLAACVGLQVAAALLMALGSLRERVTAKGE